VKLAAAPPTREAEIVSVLDIPSPDPTRLGKVDVMITYRVDPLHSFTLRIPKEDATPAKIKAAVQEDWNKRKEIIGAKFTLT
jgi:hypothetical protein